MNETNTQQPEPLAAILAEMRDERIIRLDDAVVTRCLLRNLADRIEAAAEREYAEAKDYFAKLHDGPSMICTARNCAVRNVGLSLAAPGNAAALREALTAFVDSIQWLCDGDERGIFKKQFAPLLSDARAALAAPARNCDKFATRDEAWKAFERESVGYWAADWEAAFAAWLFDTAEGGAE